MKRSDTLLASTLVLVVLAGCSRGGASGSDNHGSVDQGPAAGDNTCQAVGAGFAIGRQGTQALADQAREASGARSVRVLKPNDMVTLEYRAERLSISVDDQGVVTRITCG